MESSTGIQIVLCDDNPVFLESLEKEIGSVLKKHLIAAELQSYDSADSIPEQMWMTGDLFFLDIDFEEKGYTGLDIAGNIRKFRSDAVIIFVTNFIEYAPEGYEVQAFRYILKNEVPYKLEQCLLQAIEKLQAGQEKLQINIAGDMITLPLADILYIESQGHAAILRTVNPETAAVTEHKFYASLTSLEQRLAPRGFLRIQKSYLVNMRRIKQYRCTGVLLDNGTSLPVSEKSYAEQKKQYLLWKGRQ